MKLKKFLTKNVEQSEPLFPQINSIKSQINDSNPTSPLYSKLSSESITGITNLLIANPQFIGNVINSVSNIVLDALIDKYNFEPTDKYKETIENKKHYLNKLDAYLEERKDINKTVNNELTNFLEQTTDHLTKVLNEFSISIQSRIRDAESKYGIDLIKQSILDEESTSKDSPR